MQISEKNYEDFERTVDAGLHGLQPYDAACGILLRSSTGGKDIVETIFTTKQPAKFVRQLGVYICRKCGLADICEDRLK
ncbi:hypothetical protein KBD87_03100 [Candidatus Saccharibacteria bacterium]|nr:hypothetical protein [Candidatus Saccharibacteria bacterium]